MLVALAMNGMAVGGAGFGPAAQGGTSADHANEVTVAGCLQRDRGDALTGVRTPSGFVLMNASNSPFGGSAGASDANLPVTTGSAKANTQPRSGDSTFEGGGAGASPGLIYVLEGGNDLAAYAGERVEVRGTLHSAPGKGPFTPERPRMGAPNTPHWLRVRSVRSIGKDCSR
jgi:hypothetical protein